MPCCASGCTSSSSTSSGTRRARTGTPSKRPPSSVLYTLGPVRAHYTSLFPLWRTCCFDAIVIFHQCGRISSLARHPGTRTLISALTRTIHVHIWLVIRFTVHRFRFYSACSLCATSLQAEISEQPKRGFSVLACSASLIVRKRWRAASDPLRPRSRVALALLAAVQGLAMHPRAVQNINGSSNSSHSSAR